VSCALTFGDPLYSINAHTRFYRERAGLSWAGSMSWLEYLRASYGPIDLVRNLVVGVTAYPFGNKWIPYNLWFPQGARILQLFSLAGLALFLRTREGRFLLLVLLTALLPFAFTWEIVGGGEWRFTLLAYPFYLLAAAHALDRGFVFLLQRGRRALPGKPMATAAGPSRKQSGEGLP
jgi:hypothetical protein